MPGCGTGERFNTARSGAKVFWFFFSKKNFFLKPAAPEYTLAPPRQAPQHLAPRREVCAAGSYSAPRTPPVKAINTPSYAAFGANSFCINLRNLRIESYIDKARTADRGQADFFRFGIN
jgi:hypothetical protein